MSALAAVACGIIATIACRSHGVPGTPAPATLPAPSAGARAIQIAQFAFSPPQAAAMVGDTIRWVNADAFRHTTTADSGAWNSGDLAPGGSFVLVAVRAGRFPYHCGAHPTMRGVLVVGSAHPPP